MTDAHGGLPSGLKQRVLLGWLAGLATKLADEVLWAWKRGYLLSFSRLGPAVRGGACSGAVCISRDVASTGCMSAG
jgi:hypothetical protein